MAITPRSDHDLLITLNAKVDGLIVEVKSMQDGVGKEIANHEVRIRKIEAVHDAVKQLNGVIQKVHDFEVSANVFRVLAGILGGTIFYILTQIPILLRSFKLIP